MTAKKIVMSSIIALAIVVGPYILAITYSNEKLFANFNKQNIEYSYYFAESCTYYTDFINGRGTVFKSQRIDSFYSEFFKELYPELENVDISIKFTGTFKKISEDENFSGAFYKFDKGCQEVFDALSQDNEICIRKGKYVFIVQGDELSKTFPKVIKGLRGEYQDNL